MYRKNISITVVSKRKEKVYFHLHFIMWLKCLEHIVISAWTYTTTITMKTTKLMPKWIPKWIQGFIWKIRKQCFVMSRIFQFRDDFQIKLSVVHTLRCRFCPVNIYICLDQIVGLCSIYFYGIQRNFFLLQNQIKLHYNF